MDEYAKEKYPLHPSPFLGYASWWRVKCKATEGCALKPELCCQCCFQCWQKKACSRSPGMCSWLQHSAAAPEKSHWENAWCKREWMLVERWASPMHSVLVSLTLSSAWVLSLTFFLVQGFPHMGISWLMVLPSSCVLDNCFYMQCYQKKLQSNWCIISLYDRQLFTAQICWSPSDNKQQPFTASW